MKHYDIIVVGAGPGGSNFARLVDSNRYAVLLVDGSDGHDKVCGGLLVLVGVLMATGVLGRFLTVLN